MGLLIKRFRTGFSPHLSAGLTENLKKNDLEAVKIGGGNYEKAGSVGQPSTNFVVCPSDLRNSQLWQVFEAS